LEDLPEGGKQLLKELEEQLDLEKVRCIQVFGSAVTGEVSDVSDLDLRIVLKNEHSGYRERASRTVLSLAEKNLDTESESRNSLEKAVDSSTGMFQSGMVTTETAVREGRYYDIGNVSRASAFGPWRIIMAKIFDGSVTIYGDPIEPEWSKIGRPEDMKYRELFKSLLITFALSSSQWLYSFFSSRATLYSMEAYKWTVFNCSFLLSEEIHGLERSIKICPGLLDIKERFKDLRESYETDLSFVFKAPIEITAAHIKTFGTILNS
ncbi:MAG: nucleotidyltransferase domain-containing protein, partial [Candidatus Nanohaloarchaea archaeon]|nr:nucleotidyltransferase domain-containing protein [Candidatus Nanohaloarchaea archaeon]